MVTCGKMRRIESPREESPPTGGPHGLGKPQGPGGFAPPRRLPRRGQGCHSCLSLVAEVPGLPDGQTSSIDAADRATQRVQRAREQPGDVHLRDAELLRDLALGHSRDKAVIEEKTFAFGKRPQ